MALWADAILEVRGAGMRSVELVPASVRRALRRQFQITNNGTFAYLEFDTRDVPNGPLTVSINASNAAAGQPGRTVTAMPTRQWVISN